MEAAATVLRRTGVEDPLTGPRAFAQHLWDTWQGWHMSNEASAGRTVRAVVPKNSVAGHELQKLVEGCTVLEAGHPEIQAAGSRDSEFEHEFFEPFRVRIRGGSEHSAATTCNMANHFVPTAAYIKARSMVIDAIERKRERAVDGIDPRGPPNSLLNRLVADKCRVTQIPHAVLVCAPDHYRRAIAAANELAGGVEREWRDPRGRQAAMDELYSCVDRMMYIATDGDCRCAP